MEDVKIPREPMPTGSPLIRRLTVAASALTAASVAINLILQVAHFMEKRPVEADQRDRVDTAGLALSVLRQLPGLIKQVRLLLGQLRAA
ncbi:MAG: hypothetical protein PVSMB7_25410 [Chloroflexota bacterium]